MGSENKAGSQVLDPASFRRRKLWLLPDYCCARLAVVVVAGVFNSPVSLA
jgi:hypothetical protein